MSSFSTSAIILRKTDYQDYDLIITFFSSTKGKLSVIAKSAKKSIKRFAGVLEPFSVLHLTCRQGRGTSLPVLQEAVLKHPLTGIRADIKKTGYAGYWTELINKWLPESDQQIQLYGLFQQVLKELDLGHISEEILSIIFQMKFLSISGFYPNLNHCGICRLETTKIKNGIKNGIKKNRVLFDIKKGSLVCDRCAAQTSRKISLSKGTIKQLLWVESKNFATAKRIKFSPRALGEGLEFLETFVPYHLAIEPQSLKFLRQIRRYPVNNHK